MMQKRSVLITGCSDGGLGSALAMEFNARGCRVIATARNPSKLKDVEAAGIETVTLDVLSAVSIAASVLEVRELLGGCLDILINNAGIMYYSPVVETDIEEAKKLFDLNVWATIAVVQAYIPLLLQSKTGGIVANHSSGSSVISTPFMSIYGASKAALAMLTRGIHTELATFGIRAIDLKSGATFSNIYTNSGMSHDHRLSNNSLYYAAKDWLDRFMSGEVLGAQSVSRNLWAKTVVTAMLRPNPPIMVWAGAYTWSIWLGSYLPYGVQDLIGRNIARIPYIDKCIKNYGVAKAVADRYGPQSTTIPYRNF